jgi:hypothetical protein
MQFALKGEVLEFSFLKQGQGILGIKWALLT